MRKQHTKMGRRDWLKASALGGAGLLFSKQNSAAEARNGKRPNIVVIMVDDMGFSDPGCFGGDIHTPNIDRLASNGVRFTQFYNCARCCPTRASLMTGLYPHQVGLTLNGRSLTHGGITIAEGLKSAGYQTAMAGKWHLSRTPQLKNPALHQKWLDHQHDPGQPFGPLESYPVNRGFDKHYGIIWGVIDYYDPFSLVDGTEPVKEVPDDFYITNAITDKSVEYIRAMSQSEKPFFLYTAHCAPHWPLHALPEDIKKYEGRYKEGWDRLREERFKRQIDMGLFDEKNTPLPPVQAGAKSWDELSDKERTFQAAKMATHAAMVDRVDRGIGKMLDALEETGQLDNTIIFFLADNGASPEIPTRPGYDRSEQTREGETIRYSGFDQPGPETTYTGIGQPWSSAANTPFRYWKMQSFEGGCHTPMIVHWPKGLRVQRGSITEQPGHVMDIMPTCLELAGAEYPQEYNGHRILPLEGISLAPVLRGEKRKGHEKIFFEHERGRAVRAGDWKLVAHTQTPGKWELYNLASDRTETVNLAERYPERAASMAKAWEEWALRVKLRE